MKKNAGIVTFIITYIIVRIIYGVSGFAYNLFSDGLKIRIILDLSLWILIYCSVSKVTDYLNIKFYKNKGID
jgi:hypothetical protein